MKIKNGELKIENWVPVATLDAGMTELRIENWKIENWKLCLLEV